MCGMRRKRKWWFFLANSTNITFTRQIFDLNFLNSCFSMLYYVNCRLCRFVCLFFALIKKYLLSNQLLYKERETKTQTNKEFVPSAHFFFYFFLAMNNILRLDDCSMFEWLTRWPFFLRGNNNKITVK